MSSPHQENSEDEDLFCPALPPHLMNRNASSNSTSNSFVIGPTLPQNYVPPAVDIPPEPEIDDDEDDGHDIGPLPSNKVDERFNVPEMEYRYQKMIDDTKKDDKLVRESWMLELPSDKPKVLALGLGSRQFRKTTPLEMGDRTVWTETPEEKKRKALVEDEETDPEITIMDEATKRRDAELTELVNTYDEKMRKVPLIDAHISKKIKKEESRPNERKPFSREEDMNVNKFDEAKKETILKKARQLNDRFSSGNRKFL